MKAVITTQTALAALWCAASISLVGGNGGESNFLSENAGHSLGIPACSANVAHVACWRRDAVVPEERCVEWDSETKVCLRVERITSSETIIPEHNTQHADVSRSITRAKIVCDGSDQTCVPDGVHLTSVIDWSTVEGAEFLVLPNLPPSTNIPIYVDATIGSDHHNAGTRQSPYKSLRRALARWLYPGKCHPYCSSIDLPSSASVYLAPGVYSGEGNMNIHVLLVPGVSLSIQADPHAGGEGMFGPYMRDTQVAVTTEDRLDTFVIKASGGGALALAGFTVKNSSSMAIVAEESILLETDLQFAYGRYLDWHLDSAGNREPAWETANDYRVKGKTVTCEGAAGCRILGDVFLFDARYQGQLSVSSSACVTCGVPSPIGYTGDNGLGVYISDGGAGCLNAGTLIAVGSGPGSGFSATFTVVGGIISSITVVHPGTGYKEGSEVSIVIESGGHSCRGYVLTPYLVVAPTYPNLS